MTDPAPSIIYYNFARIFHFTPDEVDALDYQTALDFQTILSTKAQMGSQ